jgi:Protein of unknown function (DUF3168)
MLLLPERHIYMKLAAAPGVAKLVGFQIYPIAVPKGASMPFVIYKRSNVRREGTLSNTPLFMPEVSLQVASWALTYEGAKELADEVRLALDGHTGTQCGVTIHDMRLVSEVDDFLDPTAVGAQLPPAYEVRQLFQVRWSEATG